MANMISPRLKQTFRALLRGLFFFMLFPAVAWAQPSAHSAFVSLGYLDASQIFLSPQSSDPVTRNETADIGGSFSYGGGYRFEVIPSVLLQLHGEFVSAEHRATDQVGTVLSNAYDVWLIEASAAFSLPFSGKTFNMYVGGGGGFYFGTRAYSVAGVQSETVSRAPAFGMHILLGAEYLLTEHLGLRADIVFRDPQISVENRFRQPSVRSKGVDYPLDEEPFESYINLNGNVYALGLSWHF